MQTLLISGAGIAGLALAYELDKLSIPYVIIERDPQADFRNQGYGLTIIPETKKYFTDSGILPKLINQFVLMKDGYQSHNYNGQIISIDQKSHENLYRVIPRVLLRKTYIQEINQNILWGTYITHFEIIISGDNQGKILVKLINNEGHESTIIVANLIAADGINSKIREKIVNDHKQYLGVIGVYGLISIEKAKIHIEHEFQVNDKKNGWRMFAKPYNDIYYNWQMFFAWNESNPLPNTSDILQQIINDLKNMNWNQEYIDLISDTNPDTMRLSLLYDRPQLQPLKDNLPITFIGDAAHPLSPYKGRGANLALKDVQIFIQITKDEINKHKEPNWTYINRTYENIHWPQASETQLSCRQSVMNHHFNGLNNL